MESESNESSSTATVEKSSQHQEQDQEQEQLASSWSLSSSLQWWWRKSKDQPCQDHVFLSNTSINTNTSTNINKMRLRRKRKSKNRHATKFEEDGVLPLPDFTTDATRMAKSLVSAARTDNQSPKIGGESLERMVDDFIDARIESLSGLFRPKQFHGSGVSATDPVHGPVKSLLKEKRRAMELTKEEILDWVLENKMFSEELNTKLTGSSMTDASGRPEHLNNSAAIEAAKIESTLAEKTLHSSILSGNNSATHETTKIKYTRAERTEHSTIVSEINQKYKSRKEELREMAQTYLSSRRNATEFGVHVAFGDERNLQMDPMEWAFAGQGGTGNDDETQQQTFVHMDVHGRLVRRRRESMIDMEGGGTRQDQNRDETTESDGVDVKLVDAAERFWKHRAFAELQHRKKMDGFSVRPLTICDKAIHSTYYNTQTHETSLTHQSHPANQPPQERRNNNNVQPDQPFLAPLINQARQRDLAEQMNRDAAQAIERALQRYRREEERLVLSRPTAVSASLEGRARSQSLSASDEISQGFGPVFDLVPIPLVRQVNNEAESRWMRLLPFQRQQREGVANGRANNVPDDDNAHPAANGVMQQQPDRVANNGGGGWLDLRLAFRRICFAVLTVVAAFTCIMIQDLSVDFRDESIYIDGVELDSAWLSGLMGPHYQGHHTSPRTEPRTLFRGDDSDDETSAWASLWTELFGTDENRADVDFLPDKEELARILDERIGLPRTSDSEMVNLEDVTVASCDQSEGLTSSAMTPGARAVYF